MTIRKILLMALLTMGITLSYGANVTQTNVYTYTAPLTVSNTLHVSGNTQIDGTLSNATINNDYLLGTNAPSSDVGQIVGNVVFSNFVGQLSGAAYLPSNNVFTGNINSFGGKVGVGTTNPLHTITMYETEDNTVLGSNTVAAMRLINYYSLNFNRRAELQFALGTNTQFQQLGTIAGEYTDYDPTYGVGGDLVFGTKKATRPLISERMRITKDGLIGVNTNVPGAQLHVFSTNTVTGPFISEVSPSFGSVVGEFRTTGKDSILVSSKTGLVSGILYHISNNDFLNSAGAASLDNTNDTAQLISLNNRDGASSISFSGLAATTGVASTVMTLDILNGAAVIFGNASVYMTNDLGLLNLTSLYSGATNWLYTFPYLHPGYYNPTAQEKDVGLIFSKGTANSGSMIIAPWGTLNSGIRIDSNTVTIGRDSALVTSNLTLQGVNVSTQVVYVPNIPSSGQVFTATGPSSAQWQTLTAQDLQYNGTNSPDYSQYYLGYPKLTLTTNMVSVSSAGGTTITIDSFSRAFDNNFNTWTTTGTVSGVKQAYIINLTTNYSGIAYMSIVVLGGSGNSFWGQLGYGRNATAASGLVDSGVGVGDVNIGCELHAQGTVTRTNCMFKMFSGNQIIVTFNSNVSATYWIKELMVFGVTNGFNAYGTFP